MEQIPHLIEVVLIGCCALQTVRQATFGVDTDMGLHAEIPLIAFLGLVHLGITLATLILGRAGSINEGASTSVFCFIMMLASEIHWVTASKS